MAQANSTILRILEKEKPPVLSRKQELIGIIVGQVRDGVEVYPELADAIIVMLEEVERERKGPRLHALAPAKSSTQQDAQ